MACSFTWGMLSSSVTSMKLSNIERREPATITWQLTQSAKNRTCIEERTQHNYWTKIWLKNLVYPSYLWPWTNVLRFKDGHNAWMIMYKFCWRMFQSFKQLCLYLPGHTGNYCLDFNQRSRLLPLSRTKIFFGKKALKFFFTSIKFIQGSHMIFNFLQMLVKKPALTINLALSYSPVFKASFRFLISISTNWKESSLQYDGV